MTNQELNAYRLTSLEEPSDEMLSQIMKEVAEEAKIQATTAKARYDTMLREMIQKQRNAWNEKYGTDL